MSARKHAYPVIITRTKRWTNTDVVKFKQLLEKIKRPEEPPEEREEFLKLHPVCEACKNDDCTVLDEFSVRCAQCVRKRHKSCPRQILFWIVCVAQRMSKPTSVVAEMYKMYGDQVVAKYITAAPKAGPYVLDDSDSELDGEDSDRDHLPNKDRKRKRTETEDVRRADPSSSVASKVAQESNIQVRRRIQVFDRVEAVDHGNEKAPEKLDKLRTIYSLVARFSMCRDRLRSASRPFAKDPRAKRLMGVLNELECIGEEFSELLGDVNFLDELPHTT